MDLTGRLRAWSYRRQMLCRGAPDALAALRSVVGVYSSHPTTPLALLARCATFEPADLPALEAQRAAVRLPAMRQSIFLLPTEWAARALAATRLPLAKYAPRLQYAHIDWDGYARLKEELLPQLVEPKEPGALASGLDADARLATGLRLMAYEGLVLRLASSLRGDSLRYVSTEAWLGRPLDLASVDATAALAWLADQYLRGYGPGRAADFAWWSGATLGRARAAIAAHPVVDLGGGLLLPADLADAFAAVEPIGDDALDLLPKWDAYTMGHAPDGRQRLVADAHRGRAYSTARQGTGATSGDGLPLLLRGGQAIAIWSHRFDGDRLRVRVQPFDAALPASVDERLFEGVGRMLGARTIELAVERE